MAVSRHPIFGIPMIQREEPDDIKLTVTERQASKMQMEEHKQHKCKRCMARYDFNEMSFVCQKGLNAVWVMRNDTVCKKFSLDEDPGTWREDLYV